MMPKSQIKPKLDQIIEKLDGITVRVDKLEKTITSIQRHVTEVDAKLSKRYEAIERSLRKKAETAEFLELKIQIKELGKQVLKNVE